MAASQSTQKDDKDEGQKRVTAEQKAAEKTAQASAEDTGAAKVGQENQKEVAAQKAGASSPEGLDGDSDNIHLIRAGEPVSLDGIEDDSDTYVTVSKDVVLEFYPAGTKRPSHQLMFHRGDRVLKSRLTAFEDKSATAGVAQQDTRTAGQA